MREIKFRAWDTETKKMIVGIDKMKNYYEGILFIDELLNPNKAEIEEIKIMQFTGLFDKNGKEIYEGDILKKGEKIIGELYYDEKYAVFRINRDEVKGTSFVEIGILKDNFDDNEEVEVIGNKFQNPKLLK